ncbi:hypothetical protein F3Y22_tig00111983pilonHSYRG00026 [Hibiscus syriacus]|uniref:Mannan endo-1,4-beta-mannosidase n=1 Tax=Hibiscus syriacus TaxID=106335 RepID=A0A6A2YEG6_HIBSY|nr:hypothetical protein F3Y22_tig00111983pilonHSYRG00026 [Hibiscus syriacus]
MMVLAADPSTRDKVTDTFREASKYGMNIARAWAFNDDFGGKPKYVHWANRCGQNLSNEDEFFTNPFVKEFYKNHVKNWIKEMAAHAKSIDNHHLLEIRLEGFYGESMPAKKQYNPNNNPTGTDFISNDLITEIDFATIHIYPEQLDSKLAGYSLEKRDEYFQRIYTAIYNSASSGESCAGGLFWQLLTLGMDMTADDHQVVLQQCPSTACIIEQSRKLSSLT